MNVFITDESARSYWNSVQSLEEVTQPSSVVNTSNAATTPKEIRTLHVPRTTIENGKLHVLVNAQKKRRNSNHVVSHMCKEALPRGSFRRISENVFIASPEFLFLRMAKKLPFWETIRLGFELCGTYIINPTVESNNYRQPLTTALRLRYFIQAAAPLAGYQQALRALSYVVEKSNSPMETILTMLLCLPCRYGGFGLPKPEMNHAIKLSNTQIHTVGHHEFICDLLWPDKSYALEYYGREWHTGVEQVAYDARRMGELQHRGIDVTVVTYEQISSPEQVAALAMKVAKRLGVRLRKPNENCTQMRRALHAYLIGSKQE